MNFTVTDMPPCLLARYAVQGSKRSWDHLWFDPPTYVRTRQAEGRHGALETKSKSLDQEKENYDWQLLWNLF
jgi:hypothetical protein